MDLGLAGKLAVITGAARGIGLATGRAFVGEGARIIAVDIDADALEGADFGADAERLVLDVGAADAARRVSANAAAHGGTDVLVNNAGVSRPAHIADITDSDWAAVLAINLDAAFRLTRGLWQQLSERHGAIVNVASFAGKRATLFGNNASYTVSKHGISGLTRATAMDGARDGVRVNAVAPGVVATDLVKLHDEATRRRIETMIPLGRYAEPEEIAAIIVFLASKKASHVTGEIMNVNGGLVMD